MAPSRSPQHERERLIAALQAAASPVRLTILTELARAPRSVQNLAMTVGLSQPLASHHLKVLRDAGLVTVQRRGRTLIHSVVDGPVTRLVRSITRELPEDVRGTVTTTEHLTHDEHTHDHGEGCGHVAVPHADHVDYVHDGHLHRRHDGHWDECENGEHTSHDGHAHPHAHGEGCGHVAVPHRDHVDYLHDGHRHAAHEGHYDEH